MTRTQLEKELFARDTVDPVVATTLTEWLSGSCRFAAFVADNLPKVRKKLRTARDPQSAGEVLFELDIAYRLLRDKAHALVYEPFASSKRRGPDFGVSHHGRPWFLLEVTKLGEAGADRPDLRLGQAVAGKLRQFQAGQPNVLVIGVDHVHSSSALNASALNASAAVARALTDLARTAESADPTFFSRVGLRDRSDFFRHYERLALVIVTRVEAGSATGSAAEFGTPGSFGEWVNPRTRSPLENPGPTGAVRALT